MIRASQPKGPTSQAIARTALQAVEEIARLSSSTEGITRVAYSAEDMAAREWFRSYCERIGLEFSMDGVGNCFGSIAPARSPYLLIGSHLDSVIRGGRFDGVLGVCLGLALAQHYRHIESSLPLVVASFACEESTRFGFGSVGSRFFVGDLSEADLELVADPEGRTLLSYLDEAGLERTPPGRGTPRAGDAAAYLETHIDQGSMLRTMQTRLGLVTRIAGVQRIRISWIGEAAHSGARLRSERKDALLAASLLVVRLNEIWHDVDPEGAGRLALTVGRLDVQPNSPNTVPGMVELVIDLRGESGELMSSTAATVKDLCAALAEQTGCVYRWEELGVVAAAPMAEPVVNVLEESAGRRQAEWKRCISLAGHDASVLSRSIPTAMVLLANPAATSHAPEESVDPEALEQCVDLLLDALPNLAPA